MPDAVDIGLLETIPVGDIKGDFFVPAYQRGYRWGRHEVKQLLDDVRESKGATYYLQPIVVKERDDGSWELVDGQQRLTTLYLLFQYLRRSHLPAAAPNYSISYETREDSRQYLERLGTDADRERLSADAERNIDYFHMLQAYRQIESWFEDFGHRATHEATRVYGYLFEGVRVLRYEAPHDTDPTALFTRLNVGRIPLSDAELVKALLLSRSGGAAPGQTDREIEIATHWDGVERDLRSPEVWAFVTGRSGERATHMSLLLDTLAGPAQGSEPSPFYTFETLRPKIATDDPQKFWDQVVDLHALILGWYDDRDLFHKVGYLIAVGMTFQALVELSKDNGRSAFAASLDEKIHEHLKLSASDLADVSYTDTGSKAADVLLLMNTETVRRMQDSSERYSFKAHAAGAWTLEHIHAQSAEALTRTEQWAEWLRSHHDALADLPALDGGDRVALLQRIEAALATDITRQTFRVLEQAVTAMFTASGEHADESIHSISNLALLDHRDNSALNNSVFEVKRRLIITRDKQGSYIPVCTRNVFLKYYTTAGEQQLHFWSGPDRQAYFAAIQSVVAPYLVVPQEVVA